MVAPISYSRLYFNCIISCCWMGVFSCMGKISAKIALVSEWRLSFRCCLIAILWLVSYWWLCRVNMQALLYISCAFTATTCCENNLMIKVFDVFLWIDIVWSVGWYLIAHHIIILSYLMPSYNTGPLLSLVNWAFP